MLDVGGETVLRNLPILLHVYIMDFLWQELKSGVTRHAKQTAVASTYHPVEL